MSIEGTAEVPRVDVTPVPGIATAVFRRAGYIWLVIDTKIPTTVEDIPDELSGSIFLAEQRPHQSATVIRIRAREDLSPLWITDDDAWGLELVPRSVPPRAPVVVQREVDSPLGARVVLAVKKTGNRLTLEDPEVGDTMFVVPVNSPSGVVANRAFLQFAIGATTRGVVVTPFADDIGVRLVRTGIEISSDQGLLISESAAGGSTLSGGASKPDRLTEPPTKGANEDKATSSTKQADATAEQNEGEEEAAAKLPTPASVFRYANWRQRAGQTFMEARDETMKKTSIVVRALRNPPRWDLARLYFANGMAVEALGVMQLLEENDPLAAEDPVFRALRGVAQMQMMRYDEAEPNIFYSSLDTDPGVHLWRGAWHASQENWLEAHQEFAIGGDAAFGLFPPKERAVLRIAAVRAALEQEDYETADLILTSLVEEVPTPGLRAQAMLLIARAKDALEDPAGALEAVEEAIAIDDRLGRAEGNYLKAELRLKYGEIESAEAVEQLEKLRFAWRGGDYEFRLLNRVANLHIDQEKYADALKALREIVTYFPDDDASKEAGQRMDELFRDLFLNGRADNLDPINALALYFDFRELTPLGRDGDQMIRILADRMAAVDAIPCRNIGGGGPTGQALNAAIGFTAGQQRVSIGKACGTALNLTGLLNTGGLLHVEQRQTIVATSGAMVDLTLQRPIHPVAVFVDTVAGDLKAHHAFTAILRHTVAVYKSRLACFVSASMTGFRAPANGNGVEHRRTTIVAAATTGTHPTQVARPTLLRTVKALKSVEPFATQGLWVAEVAIQTVTAVPTCTSAKVDVQFGATRRDAARENKQC